MSSSNRKVPHFSHVFIFAWLHQIDEEEKFQKRNIKKLDIKPITTNKWQMNFLQIVETKSNFNK